MATRDAPVPVPGESVPDGSRVFSFRSTPMCVGCTLLLIVWYCLTHFAPLDWSTNSFACFIHTNVSFSFLS